MPPSCKWKSWLTIEGGKDEMSNAFSVSQIMHGMCLSLSLYYWWETCSFSRIAVDLLLQRRHFEARAWGGKVAKLQNCLQQNILLRMLLRFNGTLQTWAIWIQRFPKIAQLKNLFFQQVEKLYLSPHPHLQNITVLTPPRVKTIT